MFIKHFLSVLFLLFVQLVQAQFAQPMQYRDYSVQQQMNIGSGRIKLTNPVAVLELGDSIFSRKGFLPVRGWKDSIVNPVKGLQIHDIPTNRPWWFDGADWQQFGSVAAAGIDTLYRNPGSPDLEVVKGEDGFTLPDVFLNFYDNDGGFAGNRSVAGNGHTLDFNNLSRFQIYNTGTDHTYGQLNFDQGDERSINAEYNNSGTIGTDYYSYGKIFFNALSGGKSHLHFKAERNPGTMSANAVNTQIFQYPDSILFKAFSNSVTPVKRTLNLKLVSLPVTTSSSYYVLVSDTLTGQLYWKSQSGFGGGGGGTVYVDSLYRSSDSIYWRKDGFTYNLGTFLTKAGADLIYSALGHTHSLQAVTDAGATTTNALTLSAYAGSGNALMQLSSTGALARSSLDPANVIAGTTDNNLTASSNTISTRKSVQTFTDGSTITINCANGYNWKGTIAGNRTLAISNMQEGQYLTIEFIQDATGSRSITLPAGSKVINGGAGAVTLTITGGAKDILCIWYDGVNYLVTHGKNFN